MFEDILTALLAGEDVFPFYEATMIEMIQSLSKCTGLRRLSLCGLYSEEGATPRIPTVADACVHLRCRNILVQLDEIEHNP